VPQVRISAEAENDVDQIMIYTTARWGWRQTDKYIARLEDGFELLAGRPSIGRTCGSIRPGLRRFEIGNHVVFYLADSDGVLIVRVLHEQMLPTNYL